MFWALKCVFVLKMLLTRKCLRFYFLSSFERQNMKHCIPNCWKNNVMLNTVCTIHLFCNSLFPNVTFPPMLQSIIFLGTVFEWLKVLMIYNALVVSTQYSLVQVYECSGESFWVYTGSQKMEAVCLEDNLGSHQSRYTVPQPSRLILNINMHFPCIVLLPYLLQPN